MSLYIKLTDADNGGPRDNCAKAGEAPWTSPSIWINAKNPGTVATPGKNNIISVIVDRQGGADPYKATVEAWVCDPTTRPGPGGIPLPSAGDRQGLAYAPSPPTLPSPGTIDAGASYPQLVPFNWQPYPNDVTYNHGHVCIVANVYDDSTTDGTSIRGSSARVDPCNNVHHGWHNIDIVPSPMPGGARKEWIPLAFDFMVPGSDPALPVQETVVRAHVLSPDWALTPVIREGLLRSTLIELLDAE